jgi:hypothetical protein
MMNNNTTNLYNQFNSMSNKGIIWKLLSDNNAFSNIPDNKYNLIKETFDKKISIMAEQIDETNDRLINLNKKIISDMVLYLNDIKQKSNSNNVSNNVPELYSANDLSQQKQKKLEDDFNIKKNEFENLTKVNIPETPDFSDKLDTPIGSEMDKMIAEQIALREQQLNNLLNRQDIENAKKWIDNNNNNNNNDNNDNNDNIIKLKIGEDINLDLNSTSNSNNTSPKKQVSFADDIYKNTQQSVDPDNFMALLKKKGPSIADPIKPILLNNNNNNNNSVSNDDNNDIKQMLREILNKQNQILTLLQK